MPRVTRVKSERQHGSAVQLPSQRSFAVPQSQVTDSLFASSAPATNPVPDFGLSKTKKTRQASLNIPTTPLHPYSRSHIRREKRKAKQQLAGGELHTMSAALAEAIGESPEPEPKHSKRQPLSAEDKAKRAEERRRRQAEESKIDEGKGRTLGEKSRRRQVHIEAKRIPAVMLHPAFKKNPWATIRLHASNSVAMKDAPKPKSDVTKGDAMDGVEE